MKTPKQIKKVNMDEVVRKLIENKEFIDKAVREGRMDTLKARFKIADPSV